MNKAVIGYKEAEYLMLQNQFNNRVATMEITTLINILKEKGIFTEDEFYAMRDKTYQDLPEMTGVIEDLYNILQNLDEEYGISSPDTQDQTQGDKVIHPKFKRRRKSR